MLSGVFRTLLALRKMICLGLSAVPRLAVLGFGSSGQRHAASLRSRFPADEIAVYSSRPQEDSRFVMTSSLADIAKFCPDVVVVAGVATERLAMVQALPDGLEGILVEKPLADTFAKGVEIADWAARKAELTRVGYNLRFSPSIREFKSRIDRGDLGEVLSIRVETGQFLPDWRPDRDYRATASAQKALGGGALLELSHEIDYVRWIFGEIDWVSAWMGKSSDLDIDVEDTACLIVGFANSERTANKVGQMNLDLVRRDRTRSLTAVGALGSLRWDGISSTVEEYVAANDNWQQVFAEKPGPSDTYERQWDGFFSALEGHADEAATLLDGLAALQVVDAAKKSNDLAGARVTIESLGLLA